MKMSHRRWPFALATMIVSSASAVAAHPHPCDCAGTADTLDASLPAGPTMSAPDSVKAGADFEVDWTGPNNDFDYIAIFDEAGAYVTHAYAFGDDWPSPAALKAPDHAGQYELRFTNFGDVVLATRPLIVTDVTATLNAPASVRAGNRFLVEWTGPDNEYDYVGVFDAKGYLQSREFAFGEDFPSPAKIVAPSRPGTYEIRFVTGDRTLASKPIVVR